MKPVDMKLPKASKKEKMGEPLVTNDRDEYPWGLRITLNEDQVKKIEHVMNYKPDSEIEIMAKAKIITVKSVDLAGGKKDRSVEIQITGLACEGEMDDSKMSDAEYGEKHKKMKMRG